MELKPFTGELDTAPTMRPFTGELDASTPTPSRLRRFVADPLITATKGAIGLPEMAVGVADIITQGGAGKLAEAAGFRPQEAKATLDTLYSPEQQRANAEVAQAEGFLPTLKASLRNPSTIAHTVLESAPSMLGGAGVAKGLLKAGTVARPLVAAAMGEGVAGAGSTAEQIRQESTDGLITGKQALIAAGSGAATAALGLAGGAAAKKMGILDLDTVLAGGGKASKRGVAKSLAGGLVSEGALEEMPQSAQETAAQNLAMGRPLGEGVAKSAAQGLVTGAAMGGGFNAASAALGIGQRAAERKAKLLELEALEPEEQKVAVQELAAEVHAEDPVAAAAMVATTLDRLDAGEPVLDIDTQATIDAMTQETPMEATREALTKSLEESIAAGGELNPLEILAGKEDLAVLEVLKPVTVEAPVDTGPITDPALTRAQGWASTGRVVLKEGLLPDAEVAAHLDEMGFTLVKGERADRTEGGNIPRREWVVAAKQEIDNGLLDVAGADNSDPAGSVGDNPGAPAVPAQEEIAPLEEAPPATTASVKMMITKAEVAQLKARGYKQSAIDKMKPAEAAQTLSKPPAYTPLADGEQRLAFEDNPNLVVARKGNQIAVIDQKAREVLGMATLKNGKVGAWVEGKEPATAEDQSQIKRAMNEHMGIDAPRFNRASSTGTPKADIEAHLATAIKRLKVPVTIVESASEILGLTTDVEFTGVFFKGQIYLNASNLRSLREAEDVLLRHEIRHAGLRTILGKDGLEQVLKKTWGDLNSGVREFAKEKGIETRTKAGKLEAAEEYIVELAATDAKSPVWDRFVAIFKAILRDLGFTVKFTDTELRSLVARAGDAMVVEGETRFSAAWHGGPHDFDKFSSERIGTGEGAQAYGYGLYFAGSKKVAEWYKAKLSAYAGPKFFKNGESLTRIETLKEYFKPGRIVDGYGSNDKVLDFQETEDGWGWRVKVQALNAQGEPARGERPRWHSTDPDSVDVEKALVAEGVEARSPGKLYQVELAPKEDEYLLWDKPLSEQSEKVKEALSNEGAASYSEWVASLDAYSVEQLKKLANSLDRNNTVDEEWDDDTADSEKRSDIKSFLEYMHDDDPESFEDYVKGSGFQPGQTGMGIYQQLVVGKGGNDQAASEYLQSLGIRGIKYLDGSSRSEGEGDFNYVIFDDEDVSITAKFSRLDTDPKVIKAFVNKTSAQIAKRTLTDVAGNVWAAIMPVDRTIKMAESLPIYAPIKDLLNEYLLHKRAKAAATDVPPTFAQGLRLEHEKAFKTDADLKTFNDLTSKATIYEQHANGRDAGWTEKSWEESGKLKEIGKGLGQVRAEIAKLWKALSPEQQKVQQKIIDHMKVLSDQFRAAQLEPLRASFGDEAFDAAEKLSEQIWKKDAAGIAKMYEVNGADAMDLAMEMANINSSRGQLKGDYAPLMRFGDHVVRTMEVGSEKRTKTEIFESKQDALDTVARIKKEQGVYPVYELQGDGDRNVTNIPLAFLGKMAAAAEARGLTGEALAALMDDFKAARIQTMPRSTVSGNGLRREGVDGYSNDMLRSYAEYVSKSARSIARLKYGTKIEQTFRDMTNAIKAYQDPSQQWDPHAVERMSSLKDNLYKLEMQQNTEKVNEFTKAIGKTTFLWYLSSPSIWAVQWSQPFMTTIPKMAARYGAKAFGAYVKEAKNYLAGNFSDEKIEAFNVGHENAGERLYALIQEERSALPADKPRLRKTMQALYNGFNEGDQKLLILKVLSLQGMLDLSSSHALQDLISGATDGSKLMDSIVTKGAFFMQKSETGSRRAAAVSSFQLALASGKDFMEANDYASNIIDDTLADFSSQNRPALLRGNVGRVLGQFQFFRLHMLGKIVQLAKDAYGEKGWGENRKELAYMTGMSMGFAGAAGTPVAMIVSNTATNAIWAGLAAAFGDDDDPWDPKQDFENLVREAAGETMGNVFIKGLPSLFGMDISKRVGLGGMSNVISGEPPPGLSGTQKAQWYAGRALGPSFGIVSDSMRALDALGDGNYGEAVAVSSPKVLKDFIKAYGLQTRGAVGGGGNTMIQPEDVNPASIALQLLGINPMEVALAQEERREIAGLSVALRQRRSLLTKRVTEATLEGDMDARAEALEAINAWGMKQPAMAITQSELLAAVKRGRDAKAGVMSKRDQMLLEKVKGE